MYCSYMFEAQFKWFISYIMLWLIGYYWICVGIFDLIHTYAWTFVYITSKVSKYLLVSLSIVFAMDSYVFMYVIYVLLEYIYSDSDSYFSFLRHFRYVHIVLLFSRSLRRFSVLTLMRIYCSNYYVHITISLVLLPVGKYWSVYVCCYGVMYIIWICYHCNLPTD